MTTANMEAGGSAPAVAVVIPCFRERATILSVLAEIPEAVTRIYVVDDACPDGTAALVEDACADPRVTVVRHAANGGVGAATITGYRRALADGAEIIVKIDGDGQMDPRQIPRFVAPIRRGQADYTKGNRFYRPETLTPMPASRLAGNAALSFLNKFSSGYWGIFDPTNGFTAIHAKVLELLPLDRVAGGYLFETDMLYRLSTVRAVVRDVPHDAIYDGAASGLVPHRLVLPLLRRHGANFYKRLFYNYVLRDFSVATLEWVLAPLLIGFGVAFGLSSWIAAAQADEAATAGTVMISALPIIVGLQMQLSALGYDIANQPQTPLHPVLT